MLATRCDLRACNAVCNRAGHTGARRGATWHNRAAAPRRAFEWQDAHGGAGDANRGALWRQAGSRGRRTARPDAAVRRSTGRHVTAPGCAGRCASVQWFSAPPHATPCRDRRLQNRAGLWPFGASPAGRAESESKNGSMLF